MTFFIATAGEYVIWSRFYEIDTSDIAIMGLNGRVLFLTSRRIQEIQSASVYTKLSPLNLVLKIAPNNALLYPIFGLF